MHAVADALSKLRHVSLYPSSDAGTCLPTNCQNYATHLGLRRGCDYTGDTTDRHVHGTWKRDRNGRHVTLSSCVVMVTHPPLVDLEQGRMRGSERVKKIWREREGRARSTKREGRERGKIGMGEEGLLVVAR